MLRFLGFLILISCMVQAEIDDDWGAIEPIKVLSSASIKSNTLNNYWKQHFTGTLNSRLSMGTSNNKAFFNTFIMGFSEKWHHYQLIIEGSARSQWMQRSIEAYPHSDGNPDETIIHHQWMSLRQAYIVASPFKMVSLTVGRQQHVWGQLDLASPVDMLLPIDVNTAGFSLLKAANRLAQNSIKITIYPINTVEISGLYFPEFEESQFNRAYDLTHASIRNNGENRPIKKIIPSGNQQSSSAIRAIWYAPLFTSAVTYYDGFNTIIPVLKRHYAANNHTQTSAEYGYYRKKALGIELHVPMNPIGIKAETCISDTFISVKSTHSEIIHALKQHNNGFSAIPAYVMVSTVGIDANAEQWFTNIYLVNVTHIKHPSTTAFWDAYSNYEEKEYSDDNIPLFPIINIGRYLGDEKQGKLGVAMGYFTGFFGTFFYATHQLTESFSFGITLESGVYGPDAQWLNGELTNINGVKHTPHSKSTVSFGLEYRI